MTKPRFTPDPLPDGLDPTLASYLQRQFDRIDDWWPKDLEDRVKALEELASATAVGGIWPIVDYSFVSVEADAQDSIIPFECPLLSEQIYLYSPNREPRSGIYSSSANLCLMASNQVYADPMDQVWDPGVYIVDPSDDSVNVLFAPGTQHHSEYHPMFVSPWGETDNHEYVFYYVQDPLYSNRSRIAVYNIQSDLYLDVGPYDPDRLNDGFDRTPVAESRYHIMTKSNSDYFAGVSATAFLLKNIIALGGTAQYVADTWTRLAMPAGWDDKGLPAAFYGPTEKFIGAITNVAVGSQRRGIAVYQEPTNEVPVPSVEITQADLTGDGRTVTEVHSPAFYYEPENCICFVVDIVTDGTKESYLLKVDGNGLVTDTVAIGTTVYTFNPNKPFLYSISYDSIQNAIYFIDYDDDLLLYYLGRFIIPTETLERCPILAPDGYDEAIYEGMVVKPEGSNFVYAADQNAQPTAGTFRTLLGKIALT